MLKYTISPEIRDAAPDYTLLAITVEIENAPTSDSLWREIEQEVESLCRDYKIEDIRHIPAIDATRKTYKTLGKDPNRYRPSAEALIRRAVKGVGLYRTLCAIDLVNLISLRTGISIGAFDMDKISGDTLSLCSGIENEPYDAIGRGQLNIGGLPVWRDSIGGIGTPTSDNERTKLTPETRRLLLTINIFHPLPAESIEILAGQIVTLIHTHIPTRPSSLSHTIVR